MDIPSTLIYDYGLASWVKEGIAPSDLKIIFIKLFIYIYIYI